MTDQPITPQPQAPSATTAQHHENASYRGQGKQTNGENYDQRTSTADVANGDDAVNLNHNGTVNLFNNCHFNYTYDGNYQPAKRNESASRNRLIRGRFSTIFGSFRWGGRAINGSEGPDPDRRTSSEEGGRDGVERGSSCQGTVAGSEHCPGCPSVCSSNRPSGDAGHAPTDPQATNGSNLPSKHRRPMDSNGAPGSTLVAARGSEPADAKDTPALVPDDGHTSAKSPSNAVSGRDEQTLTLPTSASRALTD